MFDSYIKYNLSAGLRLRVFLFMKLIHCQSIKTSKEEVKKKHTRKSTEMVTIDLIPYSILM